MDVTFTSATDPNVSLTGGFGNMLVDLTDATPPLSNGSGNGSLGQQAVSSPDCGLFQFVLYTVTMGIIGVFGFLGNTISFLVLRRDRSTPVASFLLQTLAVADNSFLVLWLVHYSMRFGYRYLEVNLEQYSAWLYIRVYTFPLLYIAQMLTIWLTVVIALNRFMAVCRPYKAPRLCTIYNVYKEVVLVTAFSILYNVPRFFELTVFKNEEGKTEWKRTDIGANKMYQTLYVDALYYLFTFVLPLLILAYVNTRVTIAYQALRRRKRRMTSRRAENENNITLVMIIVVLIFMLCQAPARIVQLVWGYRYSHCHQYHYYLIHVSNTLEVLNSSVNFLVYFCFRKRFRDIIQSGFCPGSASGGPRRDSCHFTTTEGLSLAQFDQSQPRGCLQNGGPSNNNICVSTEDIVRTPSVNGTYKGLDQHEQCHDESTEQNLEYHMPQTDV